MEFEDKAVAKQVAGMLNGNQIGGKRRSAYHYDLWSLKYLPKFKWDHLTEEIGMPIPKCAPVGCLDVLTQCNAPVQRRGTAEQSLWQGPSVTR